MADFNLSVADNVITLDSRPDVVTSGSVNIYKAAFALDESWDGYTCLACFACGPELREAVIADGQCVVPWEVLRANGYLHIGVYGTKGDQRRPTIWTREAVYITPGAWPGQETNPPTSSVFDQLVQATADNRTAAETARDEAVDAASKAQYAIGNTVWGYFEIRKDGHVYLVRSDDDTPPEFKLVNGRLIAIYEGK